MRGDFPTAASSAGERCDASVGIRVAGVAMSVELVAVSQDVEMVTRRDLLLGPLDHLALELDDLSAAHADEMIVCAKSQLAVW